MSARRNEPLRGPAKRLVETPPDYGLWLILGRLTGYLTATSGRSPQALKWTIAKQQASDDQLQERQAVASAVVAWLVFLPLAAVLGAAMIWFAASDEGSNGLEIYLQGNICPARPTNDLPQDWAVKPDSVQWVVPRPHAAPGIRTLSAEDAWSEVLAQAGAWPRDDVDLRIVQETREGTGGFIDDPSEVGGWPLLNPEEPPADSDQDRMSDWWEQRHGLDPEDPEDGPGDQDGDGYTNLEEYLNRLACLAPAHVVLEEQSVLTHETFRACLSLRASSKFTVLSGANATFQAGELVELDNGFSVELGGSLSVRTGLD